MTAASAAPLRVAVLGAAGRMGRTVCDAVDGAPDLALVARLDVGDDVSALAGTVDVAVDFTVPSATEANVHALVDAGVHAVVGTTGWTEESLGRVREHVAGVHLVTDGHGDLADRPVDGEGGL